MLQEWQRDTRLSELKNLLIDGFGVRHSGELHMRALERAIVFSALNSTRVHMTHYLIDPEKAQKGEAGLSEIEPSVTFDVRDSSMLADNEVIIAPPFLNHGTSLSAPSCQILNLHADLAPGAIAI